MANSWTSVNYPLCFSACFLIDVSTKLYPRREKPYMLPQGLEGESSLPGVTPWGPLRPLVPLHTAVTFLLKIEITPFLGPTVSSLPPFLFPFLVCKRKVSLPPKARTFFHSFPTVESPAKENFSSNSKMMPMNNKWNGTKRT